MKNRALLTLLVSGGLGLFLGLFRFPTWQVAVETAQVVAERVTYPPGNPFYIYHTKLWTVLHQVVAVLLRVGLSEIVLSKLISGLIGMLSFQALALFVYALSRQASLAIASTIVIFLTSAAEVTNVYPVTLMGTSDTYGVLGLSFCVLVVALAGSGWYRAAGFLLGLAPAVHPALGTWLWVSSAICLLWDYGNLRREFRPALTYVVAGCAVTALSLLVQLTVIYHPPTVDASAVDKYFNAFVADWDFHRAPVSLMIRPVAMNIGALVVSFLWLAAFRHTLSRSVGFVLRFVFVTAVLGLLAVPASWIPPDRLPTTLLTLMPPRLLTFGVMIFVAMILGLLGSCRSRALNSAVPFVLLAAMLIHRPHQVRERLLGAWDDFHDRSNDPFFATVAAERNGLVLTGGSLHLIQLRTGRPVLLDGGGLDSLPYAKESGPEMHRILRDVYSLDLLNPPDEAKHSAVIPDTFNKAAWQGYSREKWQSIGHAYNVTQVVTLADWSLDLPLVAQNDEHRLYRIP